MNRPAESGVRGIAIASGGAGNARKVSLVLGAAIGLAGGFAALYFATLSVFLKPIADTFGWGRGQLSAVALFSMVGSALAAPWIGKLIDRHGAQRVIAVSVLVFAAGLACLSRLPGNFAVLSALSFIVGAFATATTSPGYLSVFPRHFDQRLGAALGCAMIGLGVGAAAAPPLAQALIAALGWRQAYLWLAVLAIAFGGVAQLLCFVTGPRSAVREVQNDKAAAAAARRQDATAALQLEGDDVRTALHSRRFWTIAVALCLASAAALGAMIHLFSLLTDRGLAPSVAVATVSTVGVAAAIGRFGTGVLMDRLPARLVAALIFALGAAGLAMLALNRGGTSVLLPTVSAALFGLAIGAEGDIIPFLARRYFGRKAFGTIFGCFFSAYMLGAFAGPIAYGLAFDRFGGYTEILFVAAAACFTAAALVFTIGPYRYAPRAA